MLQVSLDGQIERAFGATLNTSRGPRGGQYWTVSALFTGKLYVGGRMLLDDDPFSDPVLSVDMMEVHGLRLATSINQPPDGEALTTPLYEVLDSLAAGDLVSGKGEFLFDTAPGQTYPSWRFRVVELVKVGVVAKAPAVAIKTRQPKVAA